MDNQMKLDMLLISIHANTKAIIEINEGILENTPDIPEDARQAIEIANQIMTTLMGMNDAMQEDIQHINNDLAEIRNLLNSRK